MQENYETFTDEERGVLENFVTNTSGHVFALKNLPEVIKGSLFSRYSRSKLGFRSLLLKEFISSEESGFTQMAADSGQNQFLAIKKAQDFYDRILDGYGDDSIGELGGAHLAVENVTMLGAKVIQDCRIGGSPLEKSTRYVYFDQKINDEYLYLREPTIMESSFKKLYIETCNHLFETYSSLVPPLKEKMAKIFPQDPNSSTGAYNAALRAKVCDCLRGLLPASTLTNVGLFGNGRFYESLIHKLHTHPFKELNQIGQRAQEELGKLIPSFIRRANPEHHTHQGFSKFSQSMQNQLDEMIGRYADGKTHSEGPHVNLLSYDPNSVKEVAAALLFEQSTLSYDEIREISSSLTSQVIDEIFDAACQARGMRRHKSPRALEHAFFTFEIIADFGAYRDLHRHRMLTQERQDLSCHLGYYTPEEIIDTAMEKPYREAMERAKEAYLQIHEEFPKQAQYIVPMAYNIRWYFHVNLRALQWLCELRSSPAGHPNYRWVAQEMARQVSDAIPEYERFFRFVDYGGYTLGRMDQEERREKKKATL